MQWPSLTDPGVVGRVCAAPGSTVAYVAEEAGGVVGWAQALGDGVLQSHLGFVAVHPDHRRRGIARLLVVATFQATRTLRMDLITDSAAGVLRGASRTRRCPASGSTPAPDARSLAARTGNNPGRSCVGPSERT